MNNLNLSQNSNNLNDSSKTQEKLYSSEVSLDDILTYSDDNSPNQSINKSLSKQNISIKNEKEKEVKPPTINSFNSEITMSFLNNNEKDKINSIKNRLNNCYKSARKPIIKRDLFNLVEEKKSINKSFNEDLNKYLKNFLKNENDFDDNIGNNLKDVSDFHASISNIFSEFEIKDISISKSNNDLKKNDSEKEKDNSQKLNRNLDINNKNQISEEHSNTNSMCNYQNISNINEISNNKNENKKSKDENDNKDIFSSVDIGEIKIKTNISLDNCSKKKFNNDKKSYLEDIIDTHEINKKDNFTTSNKKESNSFYAQNTKQTKNSIKYTKAQCVQNLFQNNTNINIETKQYILSDAPIKTKDTTSDKKNTKKLISLSPHKLSFEIQKNDCIQISYNKNKYSTINNDLNENISYINNNSELSISKVEDMNLENNNNNNYYTNECLKQNNTTSFMISSNVNSIQKFIHRKISYQKNNKKIFINNRNINIQKEDSNNFFYNPNHPLASGPLISNNSNNKKFSDDLQTPDLNKNKMTPMTCVHKGSLVYCNESNGNNNTIKYNYSNNASNFVKGNKSMINNYSNDKRPKINYQKKLVYLKNNINKGKNNRTNNKNIRDINSKIKQATIINNKNNSFTKTNKNNNNIINQINKNINKKKNFKINTNQLIKKKNILENNNTNNSKINNSFKKNSTIKNNTINNNSLNSNNKRRIIRGINKIKLKTKSNSILNKINNEIIKESSLFHILYNNMSQRNANTTKNNSGMTSKDEKESTIIQKNSSREKEKEKPKKITQKKLVKHNTNNSFSLYNSFLEKILDDNKKKAENKNISKDKKNNKSATKKTMVGSNINKIHKKINSQINLDSLTSNFNFNNINNIMKRRKNNKSLYNFGNIFFINQNHIVKNNELESNNQNVIKYINNNAKEKSKNKVNNNKLRYNNINENENIDKNNFKDNNRLIVSTKPPTIINDFSKYKKKKEIIVREKNGTNNFNKLYNKQEYKETQLISEN